MSLGTGALKVSGVPNAMCTEEVSMATLEAGNTPKKRPVTGAVTLKGFSGNQIADHVLSKTPAYREGWSRGCNK